MSGNSPWRKERRPVRAIARRRSVLVAELLGRFGNAASVRAGRRDAAGNCQTPPRRQQAAAGGTAPGRLVR
ncbi:hypothetical protein EOT10_01150 [Streptomyces antnestii]|uniref:Uncharacterized protein n=1 Tax=Streptomyces antnestii TaxID=2494256 RepID=A0A3S2Z3K4_9ACTN|nr:hypothetical protein EOT10_01150 [Streptomyces sp. San01]